MRPPPEITSAVTWQQATVLLLAMLRKDRSHVPRSIAERLLRQLLLGIAPQNRSRPAALSVVLSLP